MTKLNTEFKTHRNQSISDTASIASQLQLDSLTAKIESKEFHDKIQKLLKSFAQSDELMK